MYGRSIAIAIATSLLAGSPAIAEPVAAQAVHQASQPNDQRGPTELASASGVKLPAALQGEQSASAPKKPRAARVTTCRCGGDVAKQP